MKNVFDSLNFTASRMLNFESPTALPKTNDDFESPKACSMKRKLDDDLLLDSPSVKEKGSKKKRTEDPRESKSQLVNTIICSLNQN